MTTSQVDLNTSTNSVSAAGIERSAGSSGNGAIDGGLGNGANVSNKNSNASNGNNSNINNKPNNSNYSNNIVGSNNSRITDTGKRKKLKARNISVPNTNTSYSKDHLDAWLETCLKDASNTQLSSSSEFLDYNPTATNTAAAATMSNLILNKNSPFGQQQLPTQPPQPNVPPIYTGIANVNNFNAHSTHSQQQFGIRNSSSQPTMAYASGFGSPFSQGFQRNMPNYMKHSNSFNNRYSMVFPTSNGFYPINDGAQDFASLPPLVNLLGTSSELENNSTDVLDGSGSHPNISRSFRFSDPCLLNPSDNDSKVSGQNTPDRRNHAAPEMENNKFFATLMEQINMLHETYSKLCRNLHETKVDIEALKHAPNWGLRHRRDSLSGLSTHSQPMIFGGGFGTQSPAPTYHSGAYTPGMMTDVVREVKEAARVREDALLNRVKALVEERQWSMNESNLRMMRDIEELKSQVQHLRAERKETNKRINQLETENKYMRQMFGTIFNNRNAPDIIYENEALRMRKPHGHTQARRTQPLHLNYGTVHHQPMASSLSVEEQDEPLHIHETPSTTSTADIASVNVPRPADIRNSFSSTDSGGGASVAASAHNSSNSNNKGQISSPPNFALISVPADDTKRKKEKSKTKSTKVKNADFTAQTQNNANVAAAAAAALASNQQLERELSVAVAARKEADDRIIALETLVKNLRVNSTHNLDGSIIIANGDGSKIGVGINSLNAAKPAGQTGAVLQTHTWQKPSPNSVPSHMQTNNKQQQAFTISTTSVNTTLIAPKLSVAGPITDL